MALEIYPMKTEQELWELLFQLGEIRPAKPKATLFEVIVDQKDLKLAKRFIAGGHKLSERYAGGHSLSLAAKHGSMEMVRYFIENAPDLDQVNTVDGANSLLSAAIERIANATQEDLDLAFDIFAYLIAKPELSVLFDGAFRACAGHKQVTPALMLLDAGFEDHDVRVGQKTYTLLSQDLDERGLSEFASLLRGDAVDLEQMKRTETKQRESSRALDAELTAAFAEIEPTPKPLTGSDFKVRYKELLEQIASGELSSVLDSTDSFKGRSVIEFAAQNGLNELVEVLLQYAKPQASAKKNAAIAAATYGYLDILKRLKTHKLAVEKTAKTKNSPLSEACRYGHLAIVEYLLELGANPDCGESSGHGFSMEDLAGGEFRKQIIEALNRARKNRPG